MSCAACSVRVEKAVKNVSGVTSCSVSLLTNSMGIDGTASDSDIISAVRAAGYDAFPKSDNKKSDSKSDALTDTESPKLLKRLIASVIFLVPLMTLSMGKMFGIPLPQIFDTTPILSGLSQMLLCMVILIIGQKFFINGFKGIIKAAPNMDTLVSLGAGAAFVYSTATLYRMAISPSDASNLMEEFYFESAGTIITLITVGKFLEARAKGKTTSALKSLMSLRPDTVKVIRDNEEFTVPTDNVSVGEIFILRPGDIIPLDAVVIDGSSAVNESALTGESIPVDKISGDEVSSGTVNLSGVLKCRVTKIGEDTALSKIIQAVSDAAATKAPIARVADKVSGIFVPSVIGIAVITLIVWLLAGKAVGFALARAISVLVISCPCALGLATPVAIMVGSGVGARNGILFKTAASIESTGRITSLALDKTGTITKGQPTVTDIIPFGISETQLLTFAAALEKNSEHPLGKAVVNEAEKRGIVIPTVSGFSALTGSGVSATIENKTVFGGNFDLISGKTEITQEIKNRAEKLSEQGKTPLFFSSDGKLIGMIATADTVREDSRDAIQILQKMGIKTALITGDNEKTAKAIASEVGINDIFASVSPEKKANIIDKISSDAKKAGKNTMTAMVGDGINDAPALTKADIGMAIGAGTDVAVDAADVVLVGSNLTDVCSAIKLGRATLRKIRQNLFWAFFYNVLGIPLAAGVFIPFFNLKLNPMIAALAMSLSSFCVVSNALMLNFIKLPSKNNLSENKNTLPKEKKNMENVITLKVEGMMCCNCEAHVKKALEAIPQVKEASASHESGSVTVTLSDTVETDVLKSAIENEGYKVISEQ